MGVGIAQKGVFMKNFRKILGIIALLVIIGCSMIACGSKECSHCNGTGKACTDHSCLCWTMNNGSECYVCSGSGTVPEW